VPQGIPLQTRFGANGRTKVHVVWELSVKPIGKMRCETALQSISNASHMKVAQKPRGTADRIPCSALPLPALGRAIAYGKLSPIPGLGRWLGVERQLGRSALDSVLFWVRFGSRVSAVRGRAVPRCEISKDKTICDSACGARGGHHEPSPGDWGCATTRSPEVALAELVWRAPDQDSGANV
jgi:hypothetical protein